MKDKKSMVMIIIIGITLSLFLCFNTTVFATTGTVTTNDLRLRKDKSTSSEILKLLDENTEVEVISEDGDWCKIKSGNKVGYVSKQYIKVKDNNNTTKNEVKNETNENKNTTTEQNNVQQNTTTENVTQEQNNTENQTQNNVTKIKQATVSEEVSIRIIPLINSDEINKTKSGEKYEVLSSAGAWSYVKNESKEGWVLTAKISVTEQTTSNNDENNTKNQDNNNNDTNTTTENNNAKTDENKKEEDKKVATITYSPNQQSNYLASQIINKVVTATEMELQSKVGKEVVSTLSDTLAEVPDSLQEISDGADKIYDGTSDLNSGLKDLNSGIGLLNSKYTDFDNGVKSAYAGSSSLNNGVSQVNEGVASLESGATTLDDAIAQINAGVDSISSNGGDKISVLTQGIEDLNTGATGVNNGVQGYTQNTDALTQKVQDYTTLVNTFDDKQNQLLQSIIQYDQAINGTEVTNKNINEIFEKEKQNLSKKYGKPFCETDPVREKNCIGFFNRNNLFGIPEWEIFQQASDGSLIKSRMSGGILGYDEPVFIMKNSTDSSLVDNETLPTGVFTRVGNYSYTTVLGGNKTIIKLKRLE